MSERQYTVYCKDGWKRTWTYPHGGSRFARWLFKTPKVVDFNGEPGISITVNGKSADYYLRGRSYPYEYRLLREFYRLMSHVYDGRQWVWLEGNPVPIDFNEAKWKSHMDGMAYVTKDVLDSDAPLKLMRPLKVPWLMIILPALVMLMLGFVLGGYVK
jgi:hypothetical protein